MRATWHSRVANVLEYEIGTDTARLSLVGMPLSWLSKEEVEQGFVAIHPGIVLDYHSKVALQRIDDSWQIIDIEV